MCVTLKHRFRENLTLRVELLFFPTTSGHMVIDPLEILKISEVDEDLAFTRTHRDADACGQVLGK